MTMGDRVAVLKDGLLQQVGTPRELYDHPDNVFVAGFIGSPAMNLMEAPIASDGAHFGGGVFSVERSVLDAAAARGDKSITLGFRPEDLRLTDGGVPVEVLVVEELGADAYVYGEIAQVTGEKKDIVVRVEGRRPPAKGDVIHVSVVEGHSHVFATSTGERLG
jgi:multiple sugar transport system ATP-binding protein